MPSLRKGATAKSADIKAPMSTVSVSCEAGGEAASYSLHVLSAGEEPFYVRRRWAELKDLAAEVRQRHAPGCRLQPRARATPPCSRG